MTGGPIKTMKLYHQVDRVFNELRALGYGADDPIDVAALSAFDQYHYLGTAAVDEAVERLGIDRDTRVLEVGGGIGGPSRHLAHSAGCRVTTVELQPDLNDTAIALTRRCGLADKVLHLCGDFLDGLDHGPGFDALVSWLTFLHIPERPALYARCFEALKPGGGMYVEDYFARGALTERERADLAEHVYCRHVPSMRDYREQLYAAGFDHIELDDMSAPWTAFVIERYRLFSENRERNLALHGADIVDGLDHFYRTVVDLFSGGNLGGIRVLAWKKG